MDSADLDLSKPAAPIEANAPPAAMIDGSQPLAVPAAVPAKALKIMPSHFKPAANLRNLWVLVAPAGTAVEALLDPGYWTHVAKILRPTDRIEVNPEDGSYFAELIVRAVGPLSAQVTLLCHHPLEAVTPEVSGFSIEWKGSLQRYTVIRTKDQHALQGGFDTREAGANWLALNAKTLAA